MDEYNYNPDMVLYNIMELHMMAVAVLTGNCLESLEELVLFVFFFYKL